MANSKVGLTTNAITGILPTANGGTGNTSGAAITATANGADNRVATYSSATALNGEATLTYDATTLSIIPTGTQSNIRLQNSTTGSNASDGFLIQETGNDTYLVNYENAGMYFRTNNTDHMQITAGGAVLIKQGIYAISDTNTGIQFDGSDVITAHTAGAERMRILSGGEVVINRASTFFGGNILQIVGNSNAEVVAIAVATDGKKAIQFANAALSDVGNIVTSSSSVAYNTTSDYRLKENVNYNFDATTRLKQLKPARFNFKTDSDTIVDGFLAHEVSSIVPEAINGTKDAMHPEVLYVDEVLYTAEDELPEGMNIGDTKSPADELPEGKNFGDVKEVSKPNHQGIDQSKLVPLLVKTIQELEARITTLENA